MMRLAIGVLCFNQLKETTTFWESLLVNTTDKTIELLVIDNGSTDGTGEWLTKNVFPQFPNSSILRNEENVGVVKGLNQVYENTTADVIVMPHNDLFFLEKDWNHRVLHEFEKDEKLGLAGFFAAKGIGKDGGRIGSMSNLIDAEVHGRRSENVETALAFDGLCLIPRRQMLNQIGGLDKNIKYHHFYDKMLSLDSYLAGWTNKFIGIRCQHISGVTANRPDYQNWVSKKMGIPQGGDLATYQEAEKYFLHKFQDKLPLIVS